MFYLGTIKGLLLLEGVLKILATVSPILKFD